MEFDDRGISPVVGTILLVAVTVIIAGSIAAFVYGLSGTGSEPVNPNLSFEGVADGENSFTISHEGGDSVPNAVSDSSWGSNLKLTIDGNEDVTHDVQKTGDDSDLDVGEEIVVTLTSDMDSDNTIRLVYTPANSIIQEVTVP